MAKPDLGGKQKCQNCGTKFFDLNKDPIVCPKCGTVQQVAGGAAARAPAGNDQDDEEAEADTGAEVVSLEDADSTEDGKVTAAGADDDVEDDDSTSDDDDTFLEEEEEDDGDVSDLIDGDIQDDEER